MLRRLWMSRTATRSSRLGNLLLTYSADLEYSQDQYGWTVTFPESLISQLTTESATTDAMTAA